MTTRTVPTVGTGTDDDPRRPDLPDGANYSIVAQHDDGTVTVEVDVDQSDRIAELEARLDEVAALAEKANVTAQDVAAAARARGRND